MAPFMITLGFQPPLFPDQESGSLGHPSRPILDTRAAHIRESVHLQPGENVSSKDLHLQRDFKILAP